MSAYALPGSFFFPTTASVSNDDAAAKLKTDQAASEADTQESWSNDLLISIKSASIDHIRLIQGLAFAGRRASTSSRRSIRDRMASLSNSLTGFSLSSSMTESDDHWGEYGYEENDNDAEEEESAGEESGGKRNIEFDFDEMDDTSPRSSVTDVPVCRASFAGDFAIPASDSSVHTNAQDDAIQFTLSISFNGRKYTATRALPTFVKLRNDLMLEVANRKKSTVRFQKSEYPHHEESSDIFYESKEQEANEEEVDVVIPELPIGGDRMNDGKNAGLIGMAGRGFRGLQDTVKQYCPPMEDWIQSVAALVPSSPTLANFLWEPLQKNEDVTFEDMNAPSTATAAGPSSSKPPSNNGKNMRNSFRNSIQTLNSIHEFEGSESENEDEEEDDNLFFDDGKEDFLA